MVAQNEVEFGGQDERDHCGGLSAAEHMKGMVFSRAHHVPALSTVADL